MAAGRLILRAVKKSERPVIPRKTIYRLSIYLRCLARLHENGIQTVSSEALAKACRRQVHATAQRPRVFPGTFGTRGLGYDVGPQRTFQKNFRRTWHVAFAAGDFGRGGAPSALALVSYRGFEKEGFEIIAAFDAEPNRKRDKEIKQPIYAMEALPEFVEQHGVKMAIVTVPVAVVQEVTNTLVKCGITGILNFAPIVLDVPEDVMVNNVNLAIELENLSYFIRE